jgi:CheY-like chemotaxis protein
MCEYGECDTHENGEPAISAFSDAWGQWRPYDIILLDIYLADITGLDVLRAIRKIEAENNVTGRHKAIILMVSSKSDQDIILKCIKEGCNDFVVKPYNTQIMKEKLTGLGLV